LTAKRQAFLQEVRYDLEDLPIMAGVVQECRMERLNTSIAWLSLGLALFGQPLVAHEKSRPCPEPTESKDTKFRPGQVWQYKTRSNEEKSTLTILKVESLPKVGTIIHIRVEKIRLRNCTGGPEPDKFEHMPFAREAIERSVTKLVKETDAPDFRSGYDEWRKACGGVYTITVAEAVNVAESGFRKNLGCGPET
jgi:hypothetical protein